MQKTVSTVSQKLHKEPVGCDFPLPALPCFLQLLGISQHMSPYDPRLQVQMNHWHNPVINKGYQQKLYDVFKKTSSTCNYKSKLKPRYRSAQSVSQLYTAPMSLQMFLTEHRVCKMMRSLNGATYVQLCYQIRCIVFFLITRHKYTMEYLK